ncbi:hypothetical protein ACEUAY_11640 [Aeromonas veronii]
MKKNIKLILAAILGGGVINANAISVSTMMATVDDDGRAVINVHNTEKYRQYISVTISELLFTGKEIERLAYSRDNIPQWALEVKPARTIIEADFEKAFAIKYLNQKEKPLLRDRVFEVSFVPAPYFAEGEDSKNAVKIVFGFAPLVIVPATEILPPQYNLSYKDGEVTVSNKGNSYFQLFLDGCSGLLPSVKMDTCSIDTTVLAGRTIKLTLPDAMKRMPSLKARIVSYKGRQRVDVTLPKQL